MPLSQPVARSLQHNRDITLRGYEREDGSFDIEAHLTDTKAYPLPNLDRGTLMPGEALHDMWIRLTVDAELLILSCEAATDSSPYAICPDIAPNFARLAGVRIGPGFNRAVKERVGGTEGCTHLRELLAQMATVAYQTLYSVRTRRRRDSGEGEPPLSPGIVGTCHAYAPDSPVVRRRKG